MNPHNQLTAAAGEIAEHINFVSLSEDGMLTNKRLIETISTNPTLVSMVKELEIAEQLLTKANDGGHKLQTKCTELQERVRELEKRLCPEPFQQGCSHEQISEALNQTTKI